MRLLSINASPEEKQLYIQNQILNRGINTNISNAPGVNTFHNITVNVETDEPFTILEANSKRRGLILTIVGATGEVNVTFGQDASQNAGIVLTPSNPIIMLGSVPTSYVSIHSDQNVVINSLEL